jgi:phosphohistidine phosphatase SixA
VRSGGSRAGLRRASNTVLQAWLGAAATLLLASALLAGCGNDGAEPAGRPAGAQALVEALRDGGHVVYLRHAATDRSQRDVLGAPLGDCARQRNLTPEGRDQARRIGEAIRALEIPVGTVVSSEYCRCLETARLAFDRVVPDPLLTGILAPGEGDYDERVAALQELLGDRPAAAANRVVVGHVKNLQAAAGGLEIEEGEAAIFEPLGGREFRLAGRIPAAAWPQLADALGPAR